MHIRLASLNRLPVRTWSWLSVNESALEIPSLGAMYHGDPFADVPVGVTIRSDVSDVDFRSSVPPRFHAAEGNLHEVVDDTARFVEQRASYRAVLEIGEDVSVEAPMTATFDLGAGEQLFDRIHVRALRGSNAKIVFRYLGGRPSADDVVPCHGGFVSFEIEEGASLTFIQIQALCDRAVHLDAIDAVVAREGKFEVLLSEIGGQEAMASCNVELLGKSAESTVNGLYLAGNDSVRDLNYRIGFVKPETIGLIRVRGALNGKARKTMKSTIDFIRGASKSQGREEESVLVLGDEVVNVSTPLLLCGEDDVSGEHATSIGRPNSEKLYYLMSRGFTEKQARILLVEASMSTMLDMIPDTDGRARVLAALREVVEA